MTDDDAAAPDDEHSAAVTTTHFSDRRCSRPDATTGAAGGDGAAFETAADPGGLTPGRHGHGRAWHRTSNPAPPT